MFFWKFYGMGYFDLLQHDIFMLRWSLGWDHKFYINLLATCCHEVNVSALLQRLMMFACQYEDQSRRNWGCKGFP